MVIRTERWIIRNHKTRVSDRNGYTHVVLTLYTYPTTKPRTKIVDISIFFSDIIYHYKTRKFGPIMKEMSESLSSYSTKDRNKVLLQMVKSSEHWIIYNRKTRVCNRNGYTHIVLTLYTLEATKSRTLTRVLLLRAIILVPLGTVR
jgi:hypothetical protein